MKRSSFVFLVLLIICLIFSYSVYAQDVEHGSDKQVSLVQSTLPDGIVISKSAVVRSGSHSKVWYFGALFRGEGYSQDVLGLWVIGGDKNKPNLVYSVNQKAKIYSGMRLASETKAAAYPSDPEAKKLIDFFKN